MKKPLDLAFSYLLTKKVDLGVAIENVIDIERFNSLQKLFRVTSCIKRFVNNLKKKVLKKETLKKPFVDSNELHMSQLQWISENQRSFDKRKLQVVRKALNIFCDENELFRCEGRFDIPVRATLFALCKNQQITFPDHRDTHVLIKIIKNIFKMN